jgi:protein ImuA
MFIQYTIGNMLQDNKRALEELHPSLWRASQLARSSSPCIDSGHPVLASQLPGGGWPTGELTELLTAQPGLGEIRLLGPALAGVAARGIILVQPPHPPQTIAFASLGIAPSQLTWVRPTKTADALWATEQILKSNSAGCVLFWAAHCRNDSLRRLHLAAHNSSSLFFLLRPLYTAQDSSPAPLRLSLQPAANGINIGFVKRRGPVSAGLLFLPLTPPGFIKRPTAPDRDPAPAPTIEAVRTWESYAETP